MGLVAVIIIGVVVGAFSKLLLPERDAGGLVVTSVLGVAGAGLATCLGQALDLYDWGEPAGYVGAAIGAMYLPLRLTPALVGEALAAQGVGVPEKCQAVIPHIAITPASWRGTAAPAAKDSHRLDEPA